MEGMGDGARTSSRRPECRPVVLIDVHVLGGRDGLEGFTQTLVCNETDQ